MGPALVMAETRACLSAGPGLRRRGRDPHAGESRAQRDVDEFNFVTLALARLDPIERTMVYASAGQRGYLLEPRGEVRVLDSTSPPLGIEHDLIVPSAPKITLHPGQLVVLFTDGVVETESPTQARFGTQRP